MRFSHTENIFSSVLLGVSRHLLDMAVEEDGQLVVQGDQHAIAEAVGSVREVVARAVRKLRDEGVLIRSDKGLVIVDHSRMVEFSRHR